MANAFEQITSMLLEREGYWTRTRYKVNLTKEEKVLIEIPSSPRWELDVLAYDPRVNLLLVVECKSYLNSSGVRYLAFTGTDKNGAKRYKLFTNEPLRRVVLARLRKQLRREGLILPKAQIRLCLAAGRIQGGKEGQLDAYCRKRGWGLFTPGWFSDKFAGLAGTAYEDDIAVVAAKLAANGNGKSSMANHGRK